MIAIAVTLTTIALNLHYRKPSTHKMPGWVRRVFIQKLPRFLLMRVPIQVIKDSMKTRRSKFLRQSDPALQSLAGEPEEVDTGGGGGSGTSTNNTATATDNNGTNNATNNGGGGALHGSTADPEKLQGQLTGHLNGLYNGLTKIMSSTCKISQDDLKAPFAIEKAIHNIMFIKHHMKRQDEFDAVRKTNKSVLIRSSVLASLSNTNLDLFFVFRRIKIGALSPWCWIVCSSGCLGSWPPWAAS